MTQLTKAVGLTIILVTTLLMSGCEEHTEIDIYDARGFTVYDGLDPVIYGELVQHSVWYDGRLIESETTLILTNVSGFAITMDLQITTPIWGEHIETTYFPDGDTINLGVVSKDPAAFNLPLSTT